jgi:DMSO/TMAO reductase YedYZ heme-binding membrane subunit
MEKNCNKEIIKGLFGVILVIFHLVIYELTINSSETIKNFFVVTGLLSFVLFFILIKPYIINCISNKEY